MLKEMFRDAQFARAVDLSGVNSINFARIAAQIVYYFTAAVALGAPRRHVSFAAPTGNFGDAFAGYAAHRMGLPIERILVATNANDILARAFADGRYERGQVTATSSPAMDIQAASNFERFYFEYVGRDPAETVRAFEAFAACGGFDIPRKAHDAMTALVAGGSASERDVFQTIRATLDETGELVDPHTAVALAVARRMARADPATPMVTLATAHPAKFSEAVRRAAGVDPPRPPSLGRIADLPERAQPIGVDVSAAKAAIRAFAAA
jgi:threonine synthase